MNKPVPERFFSNGELFAHLVLHLSVLGLAISTFGLCWGLAAFGVCLKAKEFVLFRFMGLETMAVMDY